MNEPKLRNLITECKYLEEYLEYSYGITDSAVSIANEILCSKNIFFDDEYNSKYFIETVLFTLDNLRIDLLNSINELNSIDFKTKMNEYYQIKTKTLPKCKIIVFNEDKDIYVHQNVNISKIFEEKYQANLKTIQDDNNDGSN